jgi:hypothetical protein
MDRPFKICRIDAGAGFHNTVARVNDCLPPDIHHGCSRVPSPFPCRALNHRRTALEAEGHGWVGSRGGRIALRALRCKGTSGSSGPLKSATCPMTEATSSGFGPARSRMTHGATALRKNPPKPPWRYGFRRGWRTSEIFSSRLIEIQASRASQAAASHSRSLVQRRFICPSPTAIATAFLCPTSTTSRLPRVTPV